MSLAVLTNESLFMSANISQEDVFNFFLVLEVSEYLTFAHTLMMSQEFLYNPIKLKLISSASGSESEFHNISSIPRNENWKKKKKYYISWVLHAGCFMCQICTVCLLWSLLSLPLGAYMQELHGQCWHEWDRSSNAYHAKEGGRRRNNTSTEPWLHSLPVHQTQQPLLYPLPPCSYYVYNDFLMYCTVFRMSAYMFTTNCKSLNSHVSGRND